MALYPEYQKLLDRGEYDSVEEMCNRLCLNYDDVFVEQLKNFLNKGDIVIGISGSGNSKNVLRAIEYANSNGGISIGLTGYNGGILKQIAKYSVNAKIDDMQISEDIHMMLCHMTYSILMNGYGATNSLRELLTV